MTILQPGHCHAMLLGLCFKTSRHCTSYLDAQHALRKLAKLCPKLIFGQVTCHGMLAEHAAYVVAKQLWN